MRKLNLFFKKLIQMLLNECEKPGKVLKLLHGASKQRINNYNQISKSFDITKNMKKFKFKAK